MNKTAIILYQAAAILGLIIALFFLANARSTAAERAEAFKAEIEERNDFEAYLQTESEKVKVTAKAAAQRLKQNQDNLTELRALVMSQAQDIDNLTAERDRLKAELAAMKETTEENAYKDISMTDDERDLLEWILALEATGEPMVGKKAVIEEIFNRVLRRDWKGETVKDILLAPGQFDAVNYLANPYAKPGQEEKDAIDFVLKHGRTILPEDYVYFATYKANGRDFIQIGGHYFSRG